jgi:deoxyribose-phosphate aldolase
MNSKLIDHTLLKAYATSEDIIHLCEEAKTYHFFSVCVNPVHVRLAKDQLQGTDVAICTVIGFPLGANTVEIKQAETMDAITNGADEIDMVINIGKAKEHDYDYLRNEISAVVSAAEGHLVKVIIETCYLTDEEKIEVCKMASLAGALFVKTSTGFGPSGASVPHVMLMRTTVGDKLGVKAAGGIKDAATARAMVQAGASRIGTSRGPQIAAS